MQKIVINGRFLTQETSGVQRFASEISKQLKIVFPNAEIVCPHNVLQKELYEDLNAKIIGKNTGHFWEQYDLPIYLAKYKNPLLINLANTAPLFYSNNIVTIHDLAVWDWPSSYSPPFRLFYKFLIPKIIKKSKHVITVSNFSKNRIIQHFNTNSNKIDVVYNAVSNSFNEVAGESKKEKFILAVSSLDPKKNFKNLIKGFQIANLKDYKLKVVGASNKLFKDPELEEQLKGDERVEFTGYIDDIKLKQLYQSADIFIYPSFYEGFGIPPIEAMACGCPTIVSNIAPLQEICGKSSLFVDPYSPQDIADKISILANNEALREELSLNGLNKSKEYNWEKSAYDLSNIIKALSSIN